MGNQRLVVAAGSPVISATFRAATAMPATTGTVTVGVVDWEGTEVLAPGTATTSDSNGTYTVTLPASAVASVTQLTATWAATGRTLTTTVDVVGSRLVWPDEFIDSPGVNFPSYSLTHLSDAIAWFEDLAYRHCGWSPIVRFRRPMLRSSCYRMLLPDPYVVDLLGVTWHAVGVDDVAATAPELALFEVDDAGLLIGSYLTTRASVAYAHGNPDAGQDLHDAAKDAIRVHLQESVAGRPAISINDGLQVTRFSTAGPGRPTGIPEVDEVLNAHRIPVCA